MVNRIVWCAILICGIAQAANRSDQPTDTETTTASHKEGAIDPRADAQLKRMSDYLSGLQQFRVDATTTEEKVATDGEKIQEIKESKVAIARPTGVLVKRQGPLGPVVFRYDGKQFSIFLPERNEYATAPAPA